MYTNRVPKKQNQLRTYQIRMFSKLLGWPLYLYQKSVIEQDKEEK